jgi:N-methylhydantoinase A
VIVPRSPGVLAAIGLLAAPTAADAVATNVRDLRSLSDGELESGWGALEREARRQLAGQGVEAARVSRSADCRYRGQAYELEVEVMHPSPTELAERFGRAHLDRYGYVHEGEAVEVVNLRVRAEGPPPMVSAGEVRPGVGASAARRGTRVAMVDGADVECALYDRDHLGPGDGLSGPAVVSSADSTCLLLGGQRAEVDALGNLVIREE